MEALQLYDRLVDPEVQLGRLSVRPRSVGAEELRALARAIIASLEGLIAGSVVDFEVKFREGAPNEPSPEEELSAVSTLLETVRRLRQRIMGAESKRLQHVLRTRDPQLSKTYEDTLGRAVTRLNELEKVLVLYGAGDDQDAALAADVIPPPRDDVGAGPSVYFEF